MKRLIFLVIALAVYQKWHYIDAYINPPPQFVQDHFGKVVLYATTWCGYCQKTRDLLNSKGIDYLEYDIEKSSIGKREYDQLNGSGVPLLLIDGEVVRGFNKQKILQLAL